MKDWLKFTFGSFFLNKYAMQGAWRRALNALLGFVILLVLMYTGVLVGYNSSFDTHYNNGTAFKAAVHRIFDEYGITVKPDGGNTVSSGANGELDNLTIINTFDEPDIDCDILLDTRPIATTFAEISVKAKTADGKEVPAEEYAEKTVAERKEYTLELDYAGNSLDLTQEKFIADITAFLDRTSDEADALYDAGVAEKYAALKAKRAEASEEEFDTDAYNAELYPLYFNAYYPALAGSDRYAAAPSMRSCYVTKIFDTEKAEYYVAVFDDLLVGRFVTDGGIAVVFSGYYTDMSSGEYTSDNADAFVLDAFSGGSGVNASMYLINMLQITPILLAVPLVIALVLFVLARLLKTEFGRGYGAALKIIFSFMLVTAVITFLGAIILAFTTPRGTAFTSTIIVYAVVLLTRTAVLAIPQMYADRKKAAAESEDEEQASEADVALDE